MSIIKSRTNGRWMVTHKGQLNGIEFCFFAQSSSLQLATERVLLAFANFKKQVLIFGE